jgi:FkbM family methyltransferase
MTAQALKPLARALLPRGVRNWLRSPRKSLAWGWHAARFHLGARRRVEVRPGWPLVCHPLAYRLAYRAQCDDPDQAAEFDGFITACRPGMVLFDLGAHFGLFSLAALHYGGPSARAVAVDASPTAAEMVRTQARLNGVEDRLDVVRACVCDQVGSRPMVAAGVLADGYFTAPQSDHTARELTATPATTLDHLAAYSGLTPTHVKIDVEGFEGEVLRGGRSVLTGRTAPMLFLELHVQILRQRGLDAVAVLDQLEELNYRPLDVSGTPLNRAAALLRPVVRLVAVKRGG